VVVEKEEFIQERDFIESNSLSSVMDACDCARATACPWATAAHFPRRVGTGRELEFVPRLLWSDLRKAKVWPKHACMCVCLLCQESAFSDGAIKRYTGRTTLSQKFAHARTRAHARIRTHAHTCARAHTHRKIGLAGSKSLWRVCCPLPERKERTGAKLKGTFDEQGQGEGGGEGWERERRGATKEAVRR